MPHSPPYFLNTMTKKYSIYEYEHYVNRKYGHYVNHNIVMINVDYLIPHNSSSSALESVGTKCCK